MSFMLVIFNIFYCTIMPPSANCCPEGTVMGSDSKLKASISTSVILRGFSRGLSELGAETVVA